MAKLRDAYAVYEVYIPLYERRAREPDRMPAQEDWVREQRALGRVP